MEFHEVASIFPMMGAKEFKGLMDSIQKNGQRQPIYTHDSKIVDGRNRYLACVELGIKPHFEEWDGKGLLADFVWDLNAQRRQLTGGARDIAAAKYAKAREKEARQRQVSVLRKGNSPSSSIDDDGELKDLEDFARSSEIAAKKHGISPSTVWRATKVIDKGVPELVDAVQSGQASTWAAFHVAKLPKEQQKEIVARGGEEIVKTAKTLHEINHVNPISQIPEGKEDKKEHKSLGVGIERAHEAINALRRIPINDGLRRRAFQLVKEYIRDNE